MNGCECLAGWWFVAGIAFTVGCAALFGLILFYAAEGDWQEFGP